MATGNVLSRGVFIVAAKRTAFGAFGGSLKGHSPVDLQVRTFFSFFSQKLRCRLCYGSVADPVDPYLIGLLDLDP